MIRFDVFKETFRNKVDGNARRKVSR